jgi:hypothetical protein
MRNFTRFTFMLLLWLAGSRSTRAQAPANDDPCGAVALTPSGQLCTAPTVGAIQGATSTTPNGYSNQNTCGGTFGQPADVWYRFTTAASGLASTGATITVAGNVANQVRLFSAASCAGPFTELGCQAAATANTAAPALSISSLTPSTTYYVRVASNSSGPFTICLTDGPGVPYCQPIVVGPPVYTNPDNTATTVAFTGHPSYLPSYTVFVRRYTGISSSLVRTYTTSTVAPVVLTGLVPGTRYEVEVRAFCSNGGQTAQTRTFTVPPPNDEPCGAYPLLVDPAGSCSPFPSSAAGATATVPTGYAAAGCDGNPAPNDVWYTFQTALSGPASTQAVITLNNTSAEGSLRLFAAAGCAGPFAEVACTAVVAGQAGPAALTATGLLPNTRYFVAVSLVDSPGLNRSADFTICASVLPPALPCPALRRVVVGAIRQTTALLGVQLAANGRQPLSYTATYTPVGGPVTTTTFPPTLNDPQDPFNISYLLTGLLPNTAYTLTIVANCAGGNASPALTTTFTTLAGPVITPGPPPANDHCATATLLTVGTGCTPTAGTTLDATASAAGTPLLDCAAYPSPADVWYRLLVPASGTVQVRLDSPAMAGTLPRAGPPGCPAARSTCACGPSFRQETFIRPTGRLLFARSIRPCPARWLRASRLAPLLPPQPAWHSCPGRATLALP